MIYTILKNESLFLIDSLRYGADLYRLLTRYHNYEMFHYGDNCCVIPHIIYDDLHVTVQSFIDELQIKPVNLVSPSYIRKNFCVYNETHKIKFLDDSSNVVSITLTTTLDTLKSINYIIDNFRVLTYDCYTDYESTIYPISIEQIFYIIEHTHIVEDLPMPRLDSIVDYCYANHVSMKNLKRVTDLLKSGDDTNYVLAYNLLLSLKK